MSSGLESVGSINPTLETVISVGVEQVTPDTLPRYEGGVDRTRVTNLVTPLINALAVGELDELQRDYTTIFGELSYRNYQERAEARAIARSRIEAAATILDATAPFVMSLEELWDINSAMNMARHQADKDHKVGWEEWMFAKAHKLAATVFEAWCNTGESA